MWARYPTALVLAATALGGCSRSAHPAPALRWRPAGTLPADAGLTVDVRALLAPAAAGQPWIAVGSGQGGPTGLAPLWWTSGDGGTWRPGALRTITPDGPRSGLVAVARAGADVAAVGQAYSPIHGNARPLAWRVGGDEALTEVPVLRELFGGENGLGLAGLTGDAAGFTAAGGYVVDRAGGGSYVAATAWASADGGRWSRTEGPAAPPSAVDEIVIARGVTSGAGRRVLFGDSSPVGAGPGRPAVWCATDTGPWQRVPAAELPTTPALTTVLRAGGHLAALGFVLAGIESQPSGTDPRPIAFTSPDCTTWHRHALGPSHGNVTILDTAALGGAVVVAWQDSTGLHLDALDARDAHGRRSVSVPVTGAVRAAHFGAAGALAVAVVVTGDGAHTFTAAI